MFGYHPLIDMCFGKIFSESVAFLLILLQSFIEQKLLIKKKNSTQHFFLFSFVLFISESFLESKVIYIFSYISYKSFIAIQCIFVCGLFRVHFCKAYKVCVQIYLFIQLSILHVDIHFPAPFIQTTLFFFKLLSSFVKSQLTIFVCVEGYFTNATLSVILE